MSRRRFLGDRRLEAAVLGVFARVAVADDGGGRGGQNLALVDEADAARCRNGWRLGRNLLDGHFVEDQLRLVVGPHDGADGRPVVDVLKRFIFVVDTVAQ